MDGRLFKEDAEYELIPEKERPGYDEEIGGFENEIDKAWGCLRKIHHGWSDVDYHAMFEFHTSIDGDHGSLEAKFTDGTFVEIMRNASSLYG